jgi:disulfide bond formation protein DsbB
LLVLKKFAPEYKAPKKIVEFIADNYVAFIFIITAGATLSSLALSDILSFAPCKLCWFQRAFMYPQVVIALIALFTNDFNVKKYFLPLSLIGAVIAVYHIFVQALPGIIPCGDEIVSCSSKQFAGFGYITIPVMSLTAFGLLILICLAAMRKEN